MGKKASQAGHECISSKEMILRSEDTLEEEPEERERLDECETWKGYSKCCVCVVKKKRFIIHCRHYQGCLLLSPPTFVSVILNLWGRKID